MYRYVVKSWSLFWVYDSTSRKWSAPQRKKRQSCHRGTNCNNKWELMARPTLKFDVAVDDRAGVMILENRLLGSVSRAPSLLCLPHGTYHNIATTPLPKYASLGTSVAITCDFNELLCGEDFGIQDNNMHPFFRHGVSTPHFGQYNVVKRGNIWC